MKAVILAAGEGTRLRPFTTSEPKGMLPIANKPILEYVIKALADNNIRNIIMVVGYKKERIQSYFENGSDFGVKITYVTQKKIVGRTGTGYALSMVKSKVKSDFILLPGDNLIDSRTVSGLLKAKGNHCVVIVDSDIPSKYGVVELSGNVVKNIIEKPEEEISNLISTGIYKLPASVFDVIDKVMKAGKYDLTSVIQNIIPKKKVTAVKTTGMWKDVVYPWDMIDVNGIALHDAHAQTSGRIEKGVTIKGSVSIGEGTVVRSGTHITGPVVIGSGCEIGPLVCIMPSTSIGNNVRIEPFSYIEHSILMGDASVGASSHISNSVVSEGVELDAQFCATQRNTKIEIDNELHKVVHIGALIGERTEIGSQTTVEGGVIIGARCKIGSRCRVDKPIPDDTNVI